MAVTADEDEQGKIRMQSAVIKQSAANFAPPPPKIVKRMVCGVILAAEPGPSVGCMRTHRALAALQADQQHLRRWIGIW